ncbi:3-hydroxyisobutyrate dehydrogenase-like beta-hydroxyacid dehydrogenase [Kribbella amoyensis]|uniref:3-hydroxyisobutyrate dehydrogenase-like beta-hydroxyacid dehydrogenase n=1 Tax=Kribbella amoyensis TaxID=996641 RepID=A0A561BPA0_9ACTN|nr:NAD(P)-binding domain-containing protein [Kribbella amoyensis]TWD80685.1 3-hydroxyisobutyrate dehydrogenase-like beta-hydroxyacid dehydrogenase [Kribbella amoyensis]
MSTREAVTVIGLGAMGSTMAEVLLAAGHPTTVWNRTPGRADRLVTAGAVEAPTAAEAVAASSLIVISQVDYNAMFDSVADADLTGKVLVNLSSDSPERLRAASTWATDHGATLVTGGIMVPPPGIGQPTAYSFYSGPRDSLDRHSATLEVLGRVEYVGSDPGLAMLFYQAMLNIFWTTLTSYFYSAALIGTAGVDLGSLRGYVATMLTEVTEDGPMGFLNLITTELERGEYPGEQNNLHMQAVGAEHLADTFAQNGLDTTMPGALAALFARADAEGHGRQGLTSVVESIRKPVA